MSLVVKVMTDKDRDFEIPEAYLKLIPGPDGPITGGVTAQDVILDDGPYDLSSIQARLIVFNLNEFQSESVFMIFDFEGMDHAAVLPNHMEHLRFNIFKQPAWVQLFIQEVALAAGEGVILHQYWTPTLDNGRKVVLVEYLNGAPGYRMAMADHRRKQLKAIPGESRNDR